MWVAFDCPARRTCACRCRRPSSTWKSGAPAWKQLRKEKCNRIAPTHFGVFDDATLHLSMLETALDEIEEFLVQVMPGDPSLEEISARFLEWTQQRSKADG